MYTTGLAEKDNVRLKCLAQDYKNNTVSWAGLEPGPLDTESSTLFFLSVLICTPS